MAAILERFRISYGQKLFLLTSAPLILSAAAIAFVVASQSRATADREIRALETQLIEVLLFLRIIGSGIFLMG